MTQPPAYDPQLIRACGLAIVMHSWGFKRLEIRFLASAQRVKIPYAQTTNPSPPVASTWLPHTPGTP